MNVRSCLRVLGPLALLTVLSGCATAEEKSAPGTDYSAATGAGLSMRFSSDMTRSDYPDACRFIPERSMRILTDAPMRSNPTITGCVWSTGLAALPTVFVKFVDIGPDASSTYERDGDGGRESRSLTLVGDRARMTSMNDGMTTRADVMKANVFFRVEDRLMNDHAHNVAEARRVVVQVARMVAAQIADGDDQSSRTVADEQQPPASGSVLANTGNESLMLTSIGVLSLTLGASLVAFARRPRPVPPT